MKILSFHLSNTSIVGIVYKNGFVESQFSISHDEYTPLFFQKMGINLQEYYLAYVLTNNLSLYKESILSHVPANSIKKVIPFYESSLFPLDDKEAYITTSYEKEKKSFHLKSHAILKESLDGLISDLKNFSLAPDGLFSWQQALDLSLKPFFDIKKQQLIFYLYEDFLYILHKKEGYIATSTISKITEENSCLPPLILALKQRSEIGSTEVFFIGQSQNLQTQIQELFDKPLIVPNLKVKASHLLHFGACLLADKNQKNLVEKISHKSTLPLSSMKTRLRNINLMATAVALIITVFIWAAQIYEEKKINHSFIHNEKLTVDESLENIEKLKIFKAIAIEAPTPLEIMAFFSSHPILNKIDPSSSLSTSFSNFKYELLSPQKAKVTIGFSFPSQVLRLEFEKHLKIIKIPFTSHPTPHISTYELEFSKNTLL